MEAVKVSMAEQPRTRPRAYVTGRHIWRFRDIPLTVIRNGKAIPNPVREAAIFVVHGMGEQEHLDTALVLRDGFEDIIDELQEVGSGEEIPPPFVYEGYWANYDDLRTTFKDEWNAFTPRERRLFSRLWKRRSFSTLGSFGWFAKQMFRLVLDPAICRKVGLVRWLSYWGVLTVGLIALTLLLFRYPRVLARVLGDVRLYIAPEGDIENAIVQRIDRRVGEQFLLLLGTNWNFESLGTKDQLNISGQPHVFSKVLWVAHSLGSVISYNVISDLFARCQELELELGDPNCALYQAKQQEIQKNLLRVREGLHRFVTIGSPLEKIAFLFPKALRRWPAHCAIRFSQVRQRHWWINFFHIWDPVSGILRNRRFKLATNLHSRLWRVPAWAHVSYWRDKSILKYLVTRAYGREIFKVEKVRFMSQHEAEKMQWANLALVYPLLTITPVALVYLIVKYWRPAGSSLWEWIQKQLGL